MSNLFGHRVNAAFRMAIALSALAVALPRATRYQGVFNC